MIIGLLNSYCEVYLLTKNKNSTTNQMVESWSLKYSGIKCRLIPLSGDERAGAGSYLSTATHKLFILKTFTLDNPGNYRIKFGNQDYDILDIQNAGGQGQHYELILALIK